MNYPHKNFAFMAALAKVENGIKAGYNPATDTWSPHPSPEGGLPTIGYGHKLTQEEMDHGEIVINGKPRDFISAGLGDSLVMDLFVEDVKKAEAVAFGQWNHYRGQAGEGLIGSQFLADKYRCVLTNLAFNLGTLVRNEKLQWPNLFRAIHAGDDTRVRQEMVTSYRRPDGTRVRLTKRAEMIADAVGLGR